MAGVSTVQTNPVLCCLSDGDNWAQPSCIGSSGAAGGGGGDWGTLVTAERPLKMVVRIAEL